MRVSILQDQFAKALAMVARAVDKRPAIPVLGNILLQAERDQLVLTGTDLATSIRVTIGAKIDQPGAITLPAKTLLELVKNLSAERIDLRLDEATQTVNFRCGMTKSNLKGITATEFPPVPEPGHVDLTLPAKLLAGMIDSVAFSASTQDNRPILTGLYLHLDDSCLTMATADGYRLAVAEQAIDSTYSALVIPPADTLAEAAKLFGEGDVSLTFDDDKLHLSFDGVVVSMMLLEGKFPDFSVLMPRTWGTRLTAYTEDLLKACKRAEIFARDSNYSTRLHITGNVITVIGRSAERGDLEGTLDITQEGSPLDVAFNVTYLLEALAHINTERVVIESNGAATPGLVYPEQGNVRMIIMPMSINR